MKKCALISSVFILFASSLFAGNGQKSSSKTAQQQPAVPAADCSQMSADEQDFSTQLSDTNKSLFCSQFTPQQRMQAMQMTGQPDSLGNTMTADQSVQKVMQMGGIQPKKRTGGGCPVK